MRVFQSRDRVAVYGVGLVNGIPVGHSATRKQGMVRSTYPEDEYVTVDLDTPLGEVNAQGNFYGRHDNAAVYNIRQLRKLAVKK